MMACVTHCQTCGRRIVNAPEELPALFCSETCEQADAADEEGAA